MSNDLWLVVNDALGLLSNDSLGLQCLMPDGRSNREWPAIWSETLLGLLSDDALGLLSDNAPGQAALGLPSNDFFWAAI